MDYPMRSLILAAACFFCALPAAAQQNPSDRNVRYDLQDLNFDMWCQETQKLPPDRCDKRTAADEAAFEQYRNAVEKYELQYLKRKDSDQNINRVVIHAEPVPNEDNSRHPTDKDTASQRPNP
jgi:hypothetical protein